MIAGLDEVGRGSLAGPLVTAAVILPPKIHLKGIRDSKLLTKEKRNYFFKLLLTKSHYGIGIVSAKIVDQIGPIKATNLSFIIALNNLSVKPLSLQIDGRDKHNLPYEYESIIKGDNKIRSIMAASIIAKVTRDKIMTNFHKKFPNYKFNRHMGYGTRVHRSSISKYGLSTIHRRSYCSNLASI